MSIKLNIWMPIYIGDYLSDTSRLTFQEHGAYLLLIMDYWKNGPLPDDDMILSRIIGATHDQWEEIKGIIKAYFQIHDGKLLHKRIDSEMQRINDRHTSSVERGKKGASIRWGQEENSQANSVANGQANSVANGQANSVAINQLIANHSYTDTDTDTDTQSHSNSKTQSNSKANSKTEKSTPIGKVKTLVEQKQKNLLPWEDFEWVDEELPTEISKSTSRAELVRQVFEHWKSVFTSPRSILDAKRTRAIEARLKDGYTVDQLKQAIDGCRDDDFSMGINSSGKKYNDIELICRNGVKVESFIEIATSHKAEISISAQKTLNNMNSFLEEDL